MKLGKSEKLESEKISLMRTCPLCGKKHEMSFDREALEAGWTKWKNQDMLIQDAFPSFTPNQREFLLTGICDKCFDTL